MIIVLIVIVVLGILAGGFSYSMKVETVLARHASFSSELDWLGRSGVEVAKWVLAQSSVGPNAAVDSLNQKWAGGTGDTNNILAAVDLKNYQIGNGTVSIDIKDLDRKFNINVAVQDEIILKQALTLIGVDAGNFTTITGSLMDWRDADTNPHMGGAESEVYEQQDPPYFAKDGPFDDMTELLLIRGVTPAMFWGSSGGGLPPVFNHPNPGQRGHFEEPSYAVGLMDLFATVSGRQININTTTATVLQLIPEIDENIAQAIIQARAGPDGQDGTEDDTPYRTPTEIAARVPFVNPAGIQNLSRLFTVRSIVFEAHVTASIGGTKREYVALLRRMNPKQIDTLNLYWK